MIYVTEPGQLSKGQSEAIEDALRLKRETARHNEIAVFLLSLTAALTTIITPMVAL